MAWRDFIQKNKFPLAAAALGCLFLLAFMQSNGPITPADMVSRGAAEPMMAKGMASFEGPAARSAPMVMANAAEGAAMADAAPEATARTLAYHHNVTVEVADLAAIQSQFQAAQESCKPPQCLLMNAALSANPDYPSANLSMRLVPSGVKEMVTRAAAGGTVVQQSTSAEDIGNQITDVDRRLAMAEDQFQRLQKLQDQTGGKLRDMVDLARELSQVQGTIESYRSSKERLAERVEMEVLDLNWQVPPQRAAAVNPLQQAWRSMGVTLAQSTAALISFVAGVMPWLLAFGLVFYILRGAMTGRWRVGK
jgi:hypothetical protein